MTTSSVVSSPRKKRLRWYDHLILLAIGVAGAYLGSHAVTGGYFILVEKIRIIHDWWHSLVPQKPLRNDFRDVGEGLIGGYVGQALAWKHWKYHGGAILGKIPYLSPFLEWTRKRPFLEITVSLLFSVPFAVPGFAAMYYLLSALHGHGTGFFTVIHSHASPGLWATAVNDVPSNWPQKLMGLSASFLFGRYIMRRAFDDTQLWLAERAVISRRKHVLLPNLRVRVAEIRQALPRTESGLDVSSVRANRHTVTQTVLMSASVFAFTLLAVYGWLVLAYVAQHKPFPWAWLNL